MHNTIITSFSPSNYSYLLDYRFERSNPISLLSSYCCCNCCANSANSSWSKLPISPNLLYGLRQSTLIQRSPCRRLVLDCVNQSLFRLPVRRFNGNTSINSKDYIFEERVVSGRRLNWGKGRCLCNVDDDAELILRLLSEEVGEDGFRVAERNRWGKSFRGLKLENRVRKSSGLSSKSRKKDVGSGCLESTSKRVYESIEFQPRVNRSGRTVDREEKKKDGSSRIQKGRARREGSSSSSYCSLSSSGEFESDIKVEGKDVVFMGASSSGLDKDHRVSRYEGEGLEVVERRDPYAEEQRVASKKENNGKSLNAASSDVEFDWRKKYEKKLNEELAEQSDARSSEKSFVSHKKYDDVKKISSLSQQHNQTGQRVSVLSESSLNYIQSTKMPELHEAVVEPTSSSQKQYIEQGKKSLVQVAAGVQLNNDVLITREEKHKMNSQQLNKMIENRETGKKEDSILKGVSETRLKNQRDAPALIQQLGDDTVEQHHKARQEVTRQADAMTDKQVNGISNTLDVNIQSTFISQKKSDNQMEKKDENVNSAITSYSKAPGHLSRMDSKATRSMDSRKGYKSISDHHHLEKARSSNVLSVTGTITKEKYSSMVKLIDETRERYSFSDERVSNIGLEGEAQRPKVMSFHEGVLQEAPRPQASLKWDSQSMVQQVGVNKNTNLQATIIGQPDPFQAASSVIGSSGSHEGSSFQHKFSGGDIEAREEPVSFISYKDTLNSAAQLQESSSYFVGEFFEKVRHEVSTSETTHETKFVHEDEAGEQKVLSRYSSGELQQKGHDSRPSLGSATNEPSNEKWEAEDPLEGELPDATSTAENTLVRRTGRSLWGVISDIVRLHWASHSETNHSRSAGKNSPNQSISSDAWFSGHEPDETNNENVRQVSGSMHRASPTVDEKQSSGSHTQSEGEGSNLRKSKDKIKHVKLSPSSSNPESGLAPEDISSAPFNETGEKLSVSTYSAHVIAKPSFSSPAVRGISEVEKTNACGSGSMVTIDVPVPTSLSEVSGTKDEVGEIQHRKFQRIKQVTKDRFDQWEEAYVLEAEQRKKDEMFMREALLEAQKAADLWEVPVGAVLVHDGKIIARGYNLVEELRDSTAHAEMVCIREASKLLRSWRLSETTLYVTLEPCPMCAGAMLQARIDTIVWGAPNKLLGADGSWIRLFPSRDEGQNGSEPTDKPTAPVHPFHPNIKIRRRILESECADIMQQFFQLRRRKKDKKPEPPTTSRLRIPAHPSKILTKMHNAFHIMFCM